MRKMWLELYQQVISQDFVKYRGTVREETGGMLLYWTVNCLPIRNGSNCIPTLPSSATLLKIIINALRCSIVVNSVHIAPIPRAIVAKTTLPIPSGSVKLFNITSLLWSGVLECNMPNKRLSLMCSAPAG